MKNKEIIERILAYHPPMPDYDGCDGYKSGDPEAECTGVAVALVPTVDVIRRAAQLGCNLLICHETIYYQTPDFPVWRGSFENTIQQEKEALIREAGMTIWRDHDHMHANRPDSIFSSMIKSLGWEDYFVPTPDSTTPHFYLFDLPETTTEELARFLVKTVGLNGLRYIGNPSDRISRVAFTAHIYPNSFGTDGIGADGFYHDYAMQIMEEMEKRNVHAILPGEIIDWNALAYIRDAVELGKVRACFNMGHFNWEELGMKDFARIIGELVEHKVPVAYLPTGDQWRFV